MEQKKIQLSDIEKIDLGKNVGYGIIGFLTGISSGIIISTWAETDEKDSITLIFTLGIVGMMFGLNMD